MLSLKMKNKENNESSFEKLDNDLPVGHDFFCHDCEKEKDVLINQTLHMVRFGLTEHAGKSITTSADKERVSLVKDGFRSASEFLNFIASQTKSITKDQEVVQFLEKARSGLSSKTDPGNESIFSSDSEGFMQFLESKNE